MKNNFASPFNNHINNNGNNTPHGRRCVNRSSNRVKFYCRLCDCRCDIVRLFLLRVGGSQLITNATSIHAGYENTIPSRISHRTVRIKYTRVMIWSRVRSKRLRIARNGDCSVYTVISVMISQIKFTSSSNARVVNDCYRRITGDWYKTK